MAVAGVQANMHARTNAQYSNITLFNNTTTILIIHPEVKKIPVTYIISYTCASFVSTLKTRLPIIVVSPTRRVKYIYLYRTVYNSRHNIISNTKPCVF